MEYRFTATTEPSRSSPFADADGEPGILSSVLDQISESGANILTINQNIPVDGVAPVTVSFSTGSLKMPETDLLEALSLLKASSDAVR